MLESRQEQVCSFFSAVCPHCTNQTVSVLIVVRDLADLKVVFEITTIFKKACFIYSTNLTSLFEQSQISSIQCFYN